MNKARLRNKQQSPFEFGVNFPKGITRKNRALSEMYRKCKWFYPIGKNISNCGKKNNEEGC